MSIYQRVSTQYSHQCVQKHFQPPMKLAWVDENRDWPSAWRCSYSPSYLSYCPPGPGSCPATSPTCATSHHPLLGILHDYLPSLLSLSLPSLIHHNPDCTTRWQLPPAPPSAGRHRGWVEKSNRVGLQWPSAKQDAFLCLSFLSVKWRLYSLLL